MKKKIFLLFLLCTGFAYSQCNIIYVTSTAGAAAGTMADPTSLNDALSGATNGMVIRLAIGTYTIDNPITLPTDGITIEGGFDPALAWRKTSQAGATVISRSALNPEGAANQQRLVAFYAIGRSNFRFQDLTITTANATGNGMSTYGIHLNGCSNYNIVRCQILPGNASAGAGDDNPAAYNSTWDGANGGNGVNGITGGGPQCTCSLTTDNGGTGGNGGAGGAGGANAAPIGGSAGGGNAGGRGGDGRPDNTGGAGFAGTAGGGAAPGAGGTGGAADGNGNSTSNVGNGGVGGAGTAGTNGAAGTATHIVGYFVPGAGTNGTAGTGGSGGGGGGGAGRDTDNCDAAGGGGSGGGGGGGGGGAARGGFGGGGVFGIYLYNNGASGNVIQCRILPGATGAAGLGGIGGIGGNGGTAVIGNGCTNGDTDGNRGGDGGNGGAGGVGGNGGNGSAGVSTNIHVNGGTGLVNNDNAFNLAAQPVIFMQNVNCTYQNITFSSGASALWNFAGCSSPAGPTGASVITQYTCTGRNNVTYSGGLYTGFAYISCARSTSTIAPTACTSYLSPAGNNYTVTGPYTDVITNSQGCDSVITINLTILGTTSLTWNAGGSTTVWGTAANWNTCGTPLCGVDAVVNTAALQPVLTAGTYSVRDLTINAGATVTIQNGATLQICGNLTNNGTLICQAGSNVEFVGTGLQTISGNFPASQFHHFTVTKNTGTVIITSDIVVNGNFTTTNNTSVFNNNNRNIQLFGDFLNANGNTTFTNSGTTGGLFFAGTNTQAFNAGVTQLDLNIVNINKAANGVNLNTNMNIKTVTGELQLINGDYTTGVFHIEVANTAVTSVNGGSATSYVNGNLWRSVLPTGGSYDLPVGSPTWYERVNINLLGTNTYTQLQARYDNWPSGPNILGLSECMATYNLPSEDHGYWTINQTGGNTGNYNATLYCFGATNTAGVTGWTIQKSSSVAGPWTLSGTCDMTSTAAIVKRNNMTGFSVLAAAQSTLPLPVELVEFSGTAQGTFNHLYWTTSSEINNDYFIVEKSYDGVQYEWLGEVAGSGNSNTIHNYSLSDERPANLTYYKLTQFDYNGQSETYGPIVLSNNQVESFSFVSIFPNPAKNLFYINMYSEELANVSFLIQDALGRQVHFSEKEILSNYKLEVNSIDWKPGVYFVKVYCTKYNFEKTIKLIIQ